MPNRYCVNCSRKDVCSCKCADECLREKCRALFLCVYICVLSQSQWFVLSPLPCSEESNELLMIGLVRGGTGVLWLTFTSLHLHLSSSPALLSFVCVCVTLCTISDFSERFHRSYNMCAVKLRSFFKSCGKELKHFLFVLSLFLFHQIKLMMTWRWPWCAIDQRASTS